MRGHLRRIIRRIRLRWPKTAIAIRGDSHYGRFEVRDWCEDRGISCVLGLSGNEVLARAVDASAGDIRTRRAVEKLDVLRGHAETRYGAKSWRQQRRACARIEATALGLDTRFQAKPPLIPAVQILQTTFYGMARTDLDWFVDLPWALPQEAPIDIAEARRILDAAVSGAGDVGSLQVAGGGTVALRFPGHGNLSVMTAGMRPS